MGRTISFSIPDGYDELYDELKEMNKTRSDWICKALSAKIKERHMQETLDRHLSEQRLREWNDKIRTEAETFLQLRNTRDKMIKMHTVEEADYLCEVFRKLYFQYQDLRRYHHEWHIMEDDSTVKVRLRSGDKLYD